MHGLADHRQLYGAAEVGICAASIDDGACTDAGVDLWRNACHRSSVRRRQQRRQTQGRTLAPVRRAEEWRPSL